MAKPDANLQIDVIDELAFDAKFDESNIAVAVSDGIVTLTGTVKSYAQKVDAERAVKRISCTHGITEKLTVELAAFDRRNDVDLAKSCADSLRIDSNVPADAIIVKVEDGWVTLTGTVDSKYQREDARYAIGSLTGVRGVSNEIALRHRVMASEVLAEIHESFRRSSETDASKIKIETSDDTVTLRGTVRSWAERTDAATAAYSSPGVMDVKNYMTVAK